MKFTPIIAAAGATFALALAAAPVHAANPVGATVSCPADASGDGASPATITRALYEIVSGPAGAAKDWQRLERLFAPGGLVTPTWHEGAGVLAAPQSPRQFAELNDRLLGSRGFFESEVARQVHMFGHIAHVFSSYETRAAVDGPVRARGVNSLQMMNDGKRWCVLAITWDAETPGHPLPTELAGK